ncbi:hypothetical protein B0T10DRAFT_257328 [Thelonectria olida]|uniref:Uncharacterized protein n=1 Tax=Thelonectria olida TaxID=1576542 RepID=A0A9P9AT57_9HYPO|nr:hypothetical protein B0T10DRAFT_257328 [Thelonectria olida]
MRDFEILVAQTIGFLSLWAVIDRHVRQHGPIPQARTFTLVNSWFYSAVSFVLFCLIMSPSHEATVRHLFHASKFYEYVDVLGVRAGGGDVDLHFGFHHLTTPYLSYVRVVLHSQGWRVLASLNTLHHGFMYAYFGGAVFLRRVLVVTGSAQLVVGICGEIVLLRRIESKVMWPHVVGLSLLSAYLVLWVRDVRMRRR